VTRTAIIALTCTGALAVGDWVSRARRWEWLEYVCKPGTLVALIVVAIALHPVHGLEARRAWFVVALCFSLAGDVLLMVPADRFLAGLPAFLVAHLCYLVGFFTHGPTALALAVSAVVVATVVVPLSYRIMGALQDRPRLRKAVALYIAVIAMMLATAIASRSAFAAAGAVLFAASDSMIAWDRFVRSFRAAPVAIMVTYHLGQAGLVLSLVH
jgi:uncharacterized membrane protein YhhN